MEVPLVTYLTTSISQMSTTKLSKTVCMNSGSLVFERETYFYPLFQARTTHFITKQDRYTYPLKIFSQSIVFFFIQRPHSFLCAQQCSCEKCFAQYYGETKRHIETRIAEHRGLSAHTGIPILNPSHSNIRTHYSCPRHRT